MIGAERDESRFVGYSASVRSGIHSSTYSIQKDKTYDRRASTVQPKLFVI